MPKSALHHAAANGFLPAVVKLLRDGHSTGCWDKDGWTPLHHACRNNHFDVAKELINAGADVNAQNKRKVSPLHESAYRGYLELVKVLLASGAEINATDKDGWTPLHAACRQENIDVVKILVSADADLLCRSRAGKLPRDYASDQGSTTVVSILDKYAEDHGIVYSTVPSTGKGSSSGSQQQQQQQKLQRDNQSQQSRFATSGRSSPFGQRSFASATSGGCQHNTELPTGGLSWARNVGQQTSAENHPGDGAASGAAGGKKRRQRGRGKRNAGQRAKELSQSGGTLSQDSLPGAGLDQNITTMGGDQDMNGIGQLGAGGFQDEMDNGNGSSQLGQPPTELSASASSFKPTFSPPNSGPNSPQHSPAAASVDPGSENLSRLNSWVLPEPTDQDQMAAQMAAGSSSTTVSPTMLSPIGGERRQVPHVSLGAGFDRSPGGGQPSVLSHQSLFDGILPRSSSWVPDLPLPMPIHASPLSQDSHPFAKTGGHNPNGSSLLGGGGGGGGAIDAMAASAAKHKTILHSLQAGNTATGLEETFQNFGLGGPGAIAAASSASGDQHSPRPGSQLGWAGPVDESPMERPTAGHPVEQQPYGALRGNDDALSSKMSAGWGEGHGGGNVGGRSKASASHGAASSEEWDSFGPSTPAFGPTFPAPTEQ